MRKLLLAAAALAALGVAAAVAEEMSSTVVNGKGDKIGTITVKDGPHGLVVGVALDKGALTAGPHGIHVHEHGDCSDSGFMASKGHVNPAKTEHGFLNPKGPHPSDLPNIWAHEDGSVRAEMFVVGMTLSGGDASLVDQDGSAIVIHANPDDHLSQPIGGAGARVACAVFKK